MGIEKKYTAASLVRTNGQLKKPPSRLLAVDPGKHTGLCVFVDGEPRKMEQVHTNDDLIDWLEAEPRPDLIVMEKYKLFKWLALQQSGSRMEVAQAEGIVESYGRRNGVQVIEQSPQILTTAQMWTKVRLDRGSHDRSHWKSALNHGYYYLICNNMAEIKQ